MALQTWRLIPLTAACGAENMAIDRWLLHQHRLGVAPPTLRFYTWSPIALSLGYHQRRYPADWHSLRWQGQPVELVRRPTGGRAVLHQGELTYAIITSGLQGNRRQVYEQLCQFLIEGWQRLGVTLTLGQSRQSRHSTPNCFSSATAADLVTPENIKLIGSAQRYDGDCVLQHGSIRLQPDPILFQTVLAETVETSLPSSLRSLTLSALQERVATTLAEAAADVFALRFDPVTLSTENITAALQFFPAASQSNSSAR